MKKLSVKDIIITLLLIIILILSVFLVKAKIDLKVKDQNIEMLKGQLEGKGPEIYMEKIKKFEGNFRLLVSMYSTEAVKNDGHIDDEDKLDFLEDKCESLKDKPIGAQYGVNFYKRIIYAKLPYSNTEYIIKYDMRTENVTAENSPDGAYDWNSKKA